MLGMKDDRFIIKGLAGERSLDGEVEIGGAKNSAVKLLAATLLFNDRVVLNNIPEIEDVHRIVELLQGLGSSVSRKTKGVYEIETSKNTETSINPDIAKHTRSSIVMTGPLLARFSKVSFPHPGGCVIGERPIDMFLDSFKKMGAIVKEEDEKYTIEASGGKLKGAEIFLRVPSVTGTETLMMAAVLAEGVTVIKNAALEPEIANLAKFLNNSGAKISGAGTTTIRIEGADVLNAGGQEYRVMSDRIDASSFLILGALASKQLKIKNCEPLHLESVVERLRSAGVKISTTKDSLTVFGISPSDLEPVQIKTHEYPGFPTDIQAPMAVLLTQANGESLLFETIYENRLSFTDSLITMGADILQMDAHRVLIKGPSSLHGKDLESPDIRAGLAFVIAAIIAKGESVIHNVYNIDRGYERIEERLRSIGVDIVRESSLDTSCAK